MLWYTGQWFHDGRKFTAEFCPVDGGLKPNAKRWREIPLVEGIKWWDEDEGFEGKEKNKFSCLIM